LENAHVGSLHHSDALLELELKSCPGTGEFLGRLTRTPAPNLRALRITGSDDLRPVLYALLARLAIAWPLEELVILLWPSCPTLSDPSRVVACESTPDSCA